jgi:TRAP transporter 4TM/12TM fusion protein
MRPRPFKASTWFSVGARRRPEGGFSIFITVFAVVTAVFVVSAATTVVVGPWTLGAVFLCGMMTIGFLTVGAFEDSDPRTPSWLDWVLALAAAAAGAYFALNADDIEDRISLLDELSTWAVIWGTVVFVLTIEITRRTTGLGLTIVALLFVAYNFLGHRLGGVLQHGVIDYHHFLDIMAFTTDGIFGLPTRVAATYAFLFVLFGTLLQRTGGGDFFFDFASALAGRQPGGPAKIAVISSGLYGMVSGSPTSDVVTTGSITIPIMRRLGYPGTLAGAVEVAASTGGSLVPPVMGSAAFIMAEYTGIEYADIAVAALIPAMLYYVCVYSQVHFRSLRMGLSPMEEDSIPGILPTLRRGGIFIVPLVVVTVALLRGYTPTMVAVFGTLAVLGISVLRPGSRLGPIDLVKILAETSYRMVPVAGACAAAGLIIAGITMTGLAAKLAHVVYAITDAQMLPALLLAAAMTIVFGLGMPTPSAYILAAVLMGPLLTKLGVATLPAHMFLLYYAVMSAITPPVAVAAYAASSIAEGNPLTIAVIAVRLALAAFVVPFGFVYGPALLMEAPGLEVIPAVVSAAAGVALLALAVEGHWRGPVPAWARMLLVPAGILLVLPGVAGDLAGVAGGLVGLALAAPALAYARRAAGP